MFPAMNRYRAALTHFGISALVVGTVFVLVYFLWYPQPLFRGAGGRDLFLVLALVDVTVGPLITLIIFKPGKKGLRFDLATIAVLQLAALAYGTHVVFEARPVWVVFLKDRFDLVRANQVQDESREKAAEPFRSLSLTGPRIAAARIPKDPDEQFRTMITALAGVDVSSYPQHYVPYEAVRGEVLAKAKPIRELRALNPGSGPEIDRLLRNLGREEAQVAFLPLRAGKSDLTVLVDAGSGAVLQLAALRPWKY
jgi:hypothetical protein